ncbi:MAG TPA: nitroreductase family deazaflavin-dependent oxidoreductase [Candidatus Limnocylindrales bacterium]
MSHAPTHAPTLVRRSNAIANIFVRRIPGPNTLLTVRGRTSGLPRTFPVGVVELDGRRWIMGAYGDVDWTRNLRAAGAGELRLKGHQVRVSARELPIPEAEAFYRQVLPAFIGRLPWFGRAFAKVFFGAIGPEFLHDPERAAATKPVFELTIA